MIHATAVQTVDGPADDAGFGLAGRSCMMSSSVCPLSDLDIGQKATVVSVQGGREVQSRLISMGLTVGCSVEVLRGCGGRTGPAVVASGDVRLMIGHGMTSKIVVQVE